MQTHHNLNTAYKLVQGVFYRIFVFKKKMLCMSVRNMWSFAFLYFFNVIRSSDLRSEDKSGFQCFFVCVLILMSYIDNSNKKNGVTILFFSRKFELKFRILCHF